MYKFLLYNVVLFGFINSVLGQKATIHGYVTEKGSREALIGATVYNTKFQAGTVTNTFGFYSITLPISEDSLNISFSMIGFESRLFNIALKTNQELNVELSTFTSKLTEVEIKGEKTGNAVEDTRMSTVEIPIAQIRDIPALLGEKDVFKVFQLLSGVQSGNEGNSGLYVRGGGPDQNLIILDDAIVYNAFHLFGFFSVFNGDALKNAQLTKGGFPARFGGRLSSVIELDMKEGNKEKYHGEGSIGLISSRLVVEGPIKKGKSSFLVSGRRTYLDILAQPFIKSQSSQIGHDTRAGYFFYDLNAKINHDFGNKDKLYLSGYFGKDQFYVTDKYGPNLEYVTENKIFWGNGTGTLRWNHLFSNRIFGNASLIYSNYNFQIRFKTKDPKDFFEVRFLTGISDVAFKYDLDFRPNPKHYIRLGVLTINHTFTPSALKLESTAIDTTISEIKAINSQESGIYIEDDYKISNRLKANAGIRMSSLNYKANNYYTPEPRLSLRYLLNDRYSLKCSYSIMTQYIHLLYNPGISLPTDLWLPATKNVKPQSSQQIATGVTRDIRKWDMVFTVEGYYKEMNNVLGYKEGASVFLIQDPFSNKEVNWEDLVTQGKGWSYGSEFFLHRKKGKISGWVGYTLSWTQHQFSDLNLGKKYYAKYDRRHDISIVGIYKLSENTTMSGVWVYGTGSAMTLPQADYYANSHNPGSAGTSGLIDYYNSNFVSDYGGKNEFRMEPYHRFDIAFQWHKVKRRGVRTWELSVYNVYNRKNPFFYYLNSYEGKLKKVSLFPIIPSISYTFKF